MNNGIYELSDDGKTLLGVTDWNISEAVIPDGVTHIGLKAFWFCDALQSIDIPNSVTYIGNCAFYECEALQSIDIPNSVTHIGSLAFWFCDALQSINIPNSVTYIGYEAFSRCEALQSIEVVEGNQYFASTDGVLFSKDLTQIIRYPQAKYCSQYTIPNTVTHIGDSAFSYCEALQSIVIPNSVTHIGDWAFSECIALQSIVIPNSVTHIGYEAFSGCYALQSIHIRITDIDSCCVKESAFYDIDVDNCILYIPSGTRCAYRHHPVFGRFKNIEIDGSPY